MDKQSLRQEIKARKRQFGDEQLAELSLVVIEKLLSHPRIKTAETILLYYSLADEVNTHEAIETLAAMRKRVVLPVVTDGEHMELRLYTGIQDLIKGAFGIMEPSGEPFKDLHSIDVAVVPGVAFDVSGNRLGRGKGYYDRFLAQLENTYKIGVCFDFQKERHVPVTPFDVPMNEVL